MNIYVIFYNNAPPRCSDPGQTLPSFLPRMGHFWGAPFPISCSQPHSVWDWCPNPFPLWGMLGAHGGGKKSDAKCSADTQEPKTQLHFMSKYSNPRLDYPELPLPSVASSPAAPNPAKRSQTKFLVFLFLGRAEGDLSSLSSAALQFSSWESSSATPQPPPTSMPRAQSGESFLGEIS